MEICGGHFSSKKTIVKILQCGIYQPSTFRDAHNLYKRYETCQKLEALTQKNGMSLALIHIMQVFNCGGIYFMGHFLSLCGYLNILIVVYSIAKWAEATAYHTNNQNCVMKFLKEDILSAFGILNLSLVMEALILAIKLSKFYCGNTTSNIRSWHPIIRNQMEK